MNAQPSDPSGPSNTSAVGPRLSPADRRSHLLSVARSIVEERGAPALSMESVATEAGVSRGLLYTYFSNREGLVEALWAEVADLWDVEPMPPFEQLQGSRSLRQLFDDRVVENTQWFLDQIERSGLLYTRLLAEPALESTRLAAQKRIEHANLEWWARLVEAMGVDSERARVFSALANAPSQVMWSMVARGDVPRAVIEEVFAATCGATLDRLLLDVSPR